MPPCRSRLHQQHTRTLLLLLIRENNPATTARGCRLMIAFYTGDYRSAGKTCGDGTEKRHQGQQDGAITMACRVQQAQTDRPCTSNLCWQPAYYRWPSYPCQCHPKLCMGFLFFFKKRGVNVCVGKLTSSGSVLISWCLSTERII